MGKLYEVLTGCISVIQISKCQSVSDAVGPHSEESDPYFTLKELKCRCNIGARQYLPIQGCITSELVVKNYMRIPDNRRRASLGCSHNFVVEL